MSVELSTTPIIVSKLHRPRVGKNHVQRHHLLKRLEKNCRQRPLTLVSAPAGYGKSSLVSNWLEAISIPNAWIALDESDDNLYRFLNYLLAAIRTLFPDVCRTTLDLSNAVTLPPVSTLAGYLINELERIEQPFILVLDDFHFIKDKSTLDLVSELLRHPPRPMHLVLIGRRDPALPINTMRANGRMTEIRTQDLRFTLTETEAFLQKLLGGQIDAHTVAALEEKTEGWVTGLRLATLSIRQRGAMDPKLLEPHVNAQYVMEYLYTETLSQLPPEMRQYLLGTAILDHFCGPLCEAVCLPGDDPSTCELGGWDFVSWLKKENLFLIPLDAENRWFRFHHLFRNIMVNQLKRKYSAEAIQALHTQASAWFVENGLIEEALKHALAGNDPVAAAQLIASHGVNLMNDEKWPLLEHWLNQLPADIVEKDAELLTLMAWVNTVYSRYSELLSCLDKAEALYAAGPLSGTLPGHLDALRSFQHYLALNGELALTKAQRACENIPRSHRWGRVFAHTVRAAAHQLLGDREKALSSFIAVQRDPDLNDGITQAYFQANPCYIYWMEADLAAMLQTAERSLKLAKDFQVFQAIAHGNYFLGIAHYHRNDLNAAEDKLLEVVKNRYAQHAWNFAHSAFAIALVYQAQGRAEQAGQAGESVISYALDTNNAVVLQVARAFLAELALRQGRLAEATQWAAQFDAEPFVPMYRFYVPQLTLAKVLLAQDTGDSRERADDLLKQLYDFVSLTHNTRFRIEVLALQALLHHSKQDETAALETLTEALFLAEPGGFIRLFADLGPHMADLLNRLVMQNVAVDDDYIGRILSAFNGDELSATQAESGHPTVPSAPLSTQTPVEPLTNREREILEALSQRLRNKEIAAKLFISPETVKKHLSSIYGKLNVSSRWQAIKMAKRMEILSGG